MSISESKQLAINFEGGLTERFGSCLECIAAGVYQRNLKVIACDLDLPRGNLTVMLSGDGQRHFGVDHLERYIASDRRRDADPVPRRALHGAADAPAGCRACRGRRADADPHAAPRTVGRADPAEGPPRMTTLTQRTFAVLAAMERPASGTDVRVRIDLDVQPSSIRRALGQLRAAGCIEPAYRAGREQFYRAVPGAAPPLAERGADLRTLHRARLRSRAARSWVKR